MLSHSVSRRIIIIYSYILHILTHSSIYELSLTILMAVNMEIDVLLDVTRSKKRFGESFCILLQGSFLYPRDSYLYFEGICCLHVTSVSEETIAYIFRTENTARSFV
jgi:hypothetical protein